MGEAMTKLSLADMKRMLQDSGERNTALQDEALRLRARNAKLEKAGGAMASRLTELAEGYPEGVVDAWQEARNG